MLLGTQPESTLLLRPVLQAVLSCAFIYPENIPKCKIDIYRYW